MRNRIKRASEALAADALGHAFDAPSTWLSLVGLRPRRAQLRFIKCVQTKDPKAEQQPPLNTRAMPQKIQVGQQLATGSTDAHSIKGKEFKNVF